MRRVSRNNIYDAMAQAQRVTPRMRRVSRNCSTSGRVKEVTVTPRMRRVSRNVSGDDYDEVFSKSRLV